MAGYRIDINDGRNADIKPLEPPGGGQTPLVSAGQANNEASDAAVVGEVINAGTHDGVSTSYDAPSRALSIVNEDKGSVAVAAHEATNNIHQIADVNGLQHELDLAPFESTGAVSGLGLSIHGSLTSVIIAAGSLIFVDYTTPAAPVQLEVAYAGATVAITNIASQLVTYLAIGSSGAVTQQATPFTPLQRRTLVPVGLAIHTNLSTINAVNTQVPSIHASASQLHDFLEAIGPLNISGNVYSANGANLNLNRSSGQIFKFGANTNYDDPHNLAISGGTAITFRYRTSTGTETADTTSINVTQYESPLGTLATVPNNRFTVQRITMFQSGLTRIQYGQVVYQTMADAEAGFLAEEFALESNIATNGVFRAYLIVEKSATDLSNVAQAKFKAVTKFGAAASGGTALTLANIVAALGYTPFNKAGDTATTTSAGATTNPVLIQNAGNTVNTAVDLALCPNPTGYTRAAIIRSTQSNAGDYATLDFYTVNNAAPALAFSINRFGECSTLQQFSASSLASGGGFSNGGRVILGRGNTAHEAWTEYDHSGVQYWRHGLTANAGGHFRVGRYNDSGTFQEDVLHLNRASGAVGIGGISIGYRLHIFGSGGILGMETSTARGSGNCYFEYRDPTGDKGFFGYGGSDDTFSISNSMASAMRFVNAGVVAVTIDPSGNVISLVNSTPPTLATNGQMVFNLTSNTNLRVSVRGSDGTTRVVNLTLA